VNFAWIYLLWLQTALPAQQNAAPQVDESIQVYRKVVEVRVLDRKGNPVLGLNKQDFDLTLSGRPVPIEFCEFSQKAVPDGSWQDEDVNRLNKLTKEPGRKLVFFFQGDFSGQRNTGILKGAHHSKQILKYLKDDDWVAVFSYVSHLKMHSDWTTDRRQIEDAMDDAFRNSDEFWPPDDPFHCLDDHFDREVARSIASPERALGYIGEALLSEKGMKQLFFVGWGLGRFTREGVRMTPDYQPAIQKLTQANVTVFSLDMTQADYHSLEVGMKQVSQETGGSYERTFHFTSNAFKRTMNAVQGYYLLMFEPPETELEEGFRYQLKLNSKKGRIFHKNPRFW